MATRLGCARFSHETFLFQELLRLSRKKTNHQGVFSLKSPLSLCSHLMDAQPTGQMRGEGTRVRREVHFIKCSLRSPGGGK